MTKLFTAFAAFVAIGFTVATANAGTQTTSSKEMSAAVVPAPEYNWTGFYIGGNAGANWNEFDFGGFDSVIDQPNMVTGPFTFTTPGDNGRDEMEFVGGGQIGYNFQFGRWVFGLEGDFQGLGDVDRPYTDTETSHQSSGGGFLTFFSDSTVNFRGTATTDWMASVRPRIGYSFGRILLYATGGVAFNNTTVTSRATASTREFVTVAGFGTFFLGSNFDTVNGSDEKTMVGWTVGGGLEYQITNWLTAGVEYRHTEFGDESYSFAGSSNGNIGPHSMDVNLVNDQVTAKVNILFMNLFRR